MKNRRVNACDRRNRTEDERTSEAARLAEASATAAAAVVAAVQATDIHYMRTAIDEIKAKLEKDYITRIEFEPVRKIVYGMIGIILVAVAGAVITLVIADTSK
jgi:hypothetical protein